METNVLIIERSTEEEYLSSCDGTCLRGNQCVCKVDFDTKKAGKSLMFFGIPYCVLCHRHSVTESYLKNNDLNFKLNYYVNVSSQYPTDHLLDKDNDTPGNYNGVYGSFVMYNSRDYKKVSENSILQLIPKPIDTHWITGNYVIKNEKRDGEVTSEPWDIYYCDNPKCKIGLLSCKNVRYGIGVEKTLFNLKENKTVCEKCDHEISSSVSSPFTGLICYNNMFLSRCYFCYTLIDYVPNATLQCCRWCVNSQTLESVLNTRVCARCKNIVNNNKRSGGINIYKILNEDGCRYYVYLCKNHRLKKNIKSVYTEKEFFDMIQ